MPRLPMPQDTDAYPPEVRAAVRQIQATRGSLPPPSTYLAYAGRWRTSWRRWPGRSAMAPR